MANPPDKKIPGTDKISKAAEDLTNKAEYAAAKKAAAAASAAKTSAADAAKSAVTGTAATGSAVPQTGNRGSGGRPAIAGQNTAPPSNTPPPLPKSATPTAPGSVPPKPATAPIQSDAAKPATHRVQPANPARPPVANPANVSKAATSTNAASAGLAKPANARTETARPQQTAANVSSSEAEIRSNKLERPATETTHRSSAQRPAQSMEANRRPVHRDAPARPSADTPRSAAPRPGSRPPARPAQGRPRPSRPRRAMAPPPGARKGRYIAPAARARRPGYVVPPAIAADGGTAWGPLLFGVLLLLGVLWYAIKHYAPMINADLTTRTNSALSEAGYESASVEIDGRNAILSGNVTAQPDSERAEEVVANTVGVRDVENRLTIGATDTAQTERTESSLTFFATDTGVKLSGTVSDQEYATKIETAAKEAYGEDGVSGSIKVDANTTNPGWWPAVQQLTPDLNAIEGGSFSVMNGSLRLTGSASDEQARNDIGAKATELVNGQLTVDNRITVPTTTAPTPTPLKPGYATIYNSPDRIALYGSLPADSAAAIESAIDSSDKPVESFIVTSDEFEAPSWAASLGESLNAMQEIDKGKVKVQPSGDVLISGIATSDEARQTAGEQVAALFAGQAIDNRIAVRVPAAAPAPEPASEPEPEVAPAPFMKPFATITDLGSEVTIVGLLPAATNDSITRAFESAGKTVVTNVTIDERVMEPVWGAAITQSLNSLSGIENAKVTVSSAGDLTISGMSASEGERQRAADNSLAAFGNSVSLRNDITVKGPDINELFAQIDLAAIRFRSNSSELDSDSISILDQIADALFQVPDATVAISGHTDATGKDERNRVLSAERAERVRSFLIDRGINGDRMTSQGYGSSQPIASNNTVTGRALNRRIEFGFTNGE